MRARFIRIIVGRLGIDKSLKIPPDFKKYKRIKPMCSDLLEKK